ncbi:ThiF family protein (macronuclear) [Tetrahymena thermophila SB210]|uniref:ThiF family protein n=1 Tax=Tetrahymena thermophila (strain SB210) TaxID=312017 RepID=I7M167_TETTS|nr:ThiF family protein [Tetrahymena thermophila SB210]EAR95045.1 ThiF family protein [Tetrahymena thermophila SB210]|eukprot:XP_001015290.1 ThiF family protein [Tetrahymena thermophila SB210]
MEVEQVQEQSQNQKEISNEELQVYDRQRFIGVEVQKRLLNAKVFITPANGVNTELAKNLILCGTNISIADNEIVNQDDVETNFLIAPHDLGKIRGEVVKAKLQDMNPMVKIDLYQTFDIKSFYQKYILENNVDCSFTKEFFNQFNIITSSTPIFKEMELYDEISHFLNIPYYNQLCCGLYGFFYVSLGSLFELTQAKPKIQKTKIVQGKLVKEPILFEYFHKVSLKSEKLKNFLGTNPRGSKPVYHAIQMMKRAEDLNLRYDPYNHSEENQKVLEQIVELAQEKIKNEEDREFYTNFAKFYGIEHCPVYSVIGSVASQEFIKVIAKDKMPALNWFVYDSQIGYGKIESQTDKIDATYVDLPELTRKVEEQQE